MAESELIEMDYVEEGQQVFFQSIRDQGMKNLLNKRHLSSWEMDMIFCGQDISGDF